MRSPLGSTNQQGDEDASQTSDNVMNNQSLQTRCCCKPVVSLPQCILDPSHHMDIHFRSLVHHSQGGLTVLTHPLGI